LTEHDLTYFLRMFPSKSGPSIWLLWTVRTWRQALVLWAKDFWQNELEKKKIFVEELFRQMYTIVFFMLLFFGYRDTGMDLTPYLYPEIKLFTVKTLKQIQYDKFVLRCVSCPVWLCILKTVIYLLLENRVLD
jgi:branched-subunit amino acid transport protein AzlD